MITSVARFVRRRRALRDAIALHDHQWNAIQVDDRDPLMVRGYLRGYRFANDFAGGRAELAVALAPIALGAVTEELRAYAPEPNDDGPVFWRAFHVGAVMFVEGRDKELFVDLEAEVMTPELEALVAGMPKPKSAA